MELKTLYPKDPYSTDPKKWDEKTYNIKDTVISCEAFKWGNKIGIRVFFMKEDFSTYWLFTIETLYFENNTKIRNPKQKKYLNKITVIKGDSIENIETQLRDFVDKISSGSAQDKK